VETERLAKLLLDPEVTVLLASPEWVQAWKEYHLPWVNGAESLINAIYTYPSLVSSIFDAIKSSFAQFAEQAAQIDVRVISVGQLLVALAEGPDGLVGLETRVQRADITWQEARDTRDAFRSEHCEVLDEIWEVRSSRLTESK
jgi:hypothetical protein